MTRIRGAAIAGLAALSAVTLGMTARASTVFTFPMAISAGALTCLPHAVGTVSIRASALANQMEVIVTGLPVKMTFGLFVLQVPKAPFGLSWYQGEIKTDLTGQAHRTFVGRFNIGTFAVAPGSAPAPSVFNGPFPDATLNPPFNPIQMYHLGLWFDSPADAQKAGCPATVTPFNAAHNAGIQVLNTANFPDDFGPLRHVD